MKIGIISDTHDQLDRTRLAVSMLKDAGAEVLFHCGDFMRADIVELCSDLPFYFVFGNNDCDNVPWLQSTAEACGATCLGWGGEVEIAGKRIAVAHGHLTRDLKPLLAAEPDFLFSGHSHQRKDWYEGSTRRINPGALHRAREYTVALLDSESDGLQFFTIAG